MKKYRNNTGSVDLNGIKPWSHEKATAYSLAKSGYAVVFKKESKRYKTQTADVLLDGVPWEFKAPNGKKLSSVERNLRRDKGNNIHR